MREIRKSGSTRGLWVTPEIYSIVYEATEMLINGTLPDTPYTEEMMERARSSTC